MGRSTRLTQMLKTSLMRGGLDLVTPPIAMPPGKAISAINYEPDVNGYTSHGGYERFDGHARPSDSTDPGTIAARRAAIQVVPGSGPVRGVWVYDNEVYAFRDTADGSAGAMYKSSIGGWTLQSLGFILNFVSGTTEPDEGDYVTGLTSTALGKIQRVVLRSGTWSGSAEGFLVLTEVSGTFNSSEVLLSTSGGGATTAGSQMANALANGGKYDFTNRNFYGAGLFPRMYFVNGVNTGFEWNGVALTPLETGTATGAATSVDFIIADNGDFLQADNNDFLILSADFDVPAFISNFKNHLFLGYTSGSVIFSSIGEPCEYITTTGAGEIAFGDPVTGLLGAAATSLMIFGSTRMEYVTGDDQDTFLMQPISDTSGAQPYTAQMMDTPTYLDDSGLRQIGTTAAFGDWRMGSLTQAIEPLIRRKRDDGVTAACSMKIKSQDQYKLFYSDMTGITLYLGREKPESIPFKVNFQAYCCCFGEVDSGLGDRLFVGAEDGYVYELNAGTSFDGSDIKTYIRLSFASGSHPSEIARWMKVTYEIDTPDDIQVAVKADYDYGLGLGSAEVAVDVSSGTVTVDADYYENIVFTPVQGRLEKHLSGIGPCVAVTLITEHDDKQAHTISSQTLNFSRRKLKR